LNAIYEKVRMLTLLSASRIETVLCAWHPGKLKFPPRGATTYIVTPNVKYVSKIINLRYYLLHLNVKVKVC
jgi:hypothetical protein